MEFVFIS